MKETSILDVKFVRAIPEMVENGTLYVSMDFATAVHKCCCGCGREVVTPLSPTDWKLIYDGVSVSLSPSIGNWGFPCRSHYWITRNAVKWGDQWSSERIATSRAKDRRAKAVYFGKETDQRDGQRGGSCSGFWSQLWQRLFR